MCEDNRVCAYFALTKGKLRPGVSRLLKKNAVVCEDFQSRTAGYRRQFKAINNLKADDYSARSLKDIILGFEEPEEIPTITQPQFISEKLNDSQKKAVIKSLNTENICLIQGPPGTGKTSVIKEIIGQIIRRDIKTTDSPKILIVSQSHTAVDNILEGLDVIIPDSTKIVRIGADKNISLPITEKYTIGAHERYLVETIRENIQLYRSEKEGIYAGIDDQGEKQKWEKIKAIQEDWLNRLADQESLDYQLIRSATVIAGTCIGFLANNVIRDMSFDYVIIDEAAKATTPELLVSIIRAKKIILVGDQNQLPAYANRAISETIATLTKDPNFRLFDIFYSFLPDTHKQILTTQYRMIENIGNLISEVFYDGRIDTGCSDDEKQHGIARYYGKSILWFDTSENKRKAQKKTKGGSFINEEEKRIVLEILEDLKQSGELNGKDIGIITGYSGQKDLLRKAVKANGYGAIAAIDINTLDAFQGRENDIIIYSTVRTRDSIGFQKEKERVMVLREHFKPLHVRQAYTCMPLKAVAEYQEKIKRYYYLPNKTAIEKEAIESLILSTRLLMDGEKDIIIQYLAESVRTIELMVDNIDDWAFSPRFVDDLLGIIGKAKLQISYSRSRDIENVKRRFKRGGDFDIKFIQKESGHCICWQLGGYRVYGLPERKRVIDDKTYATVMKYYLEKTDR